MTAKMKSASRAALLLLLVVVGLCNLCSFVAAEEPVFYESFEDTFEGRWIVSESGDYQGKWKHEKSDGHEDFGLLVSEKAKKYGIAVDLPTTLDFKDGAVVLQYDLRLQNGLECGGAYLKFLLPQEAGWTPSQFDNTAPYSIMFGPDKCGSTNKVHFIFRHKHPKTGEMVEHHLKNTPIPSSDKLSHVYTAIIYPNNTLVLLVDGENQKTAELLGKDFEPPVIPPKTMPDPEDKKPEDWDERAKIPDPEATKPEDWNEDAPREIEDLEAVKPEGWLDDEPDEVDDPEATKPEDWDDEEDGEWEPVKIPNPKCEEAPGCGEWKRPLKKNPDYKGKWSAPMIDNPAYKGVWKAREIDNPDYFELEQPDLEKIAAIGIEIWTMQDGIVFDNVLVTHDVDLASKYRETTWKPKFTAEKEKSKEDEEETVDTSPGAGFYSSLKDKLFEYLYQLAEVPYLETRKDKVLELIEKVEKHPDLLVGGIITFVALILGILYSVVFGGKKQKEAVSAAVSKKEDITPADDKVIENVKEETTEGVLEDESETIGEIEKEEETTGARRRTRRET